MKPKPFFLEHWSLLLGSTKNHGKVESEKDMGMSIVHPLLRAKPIRSGCSGLHPVRILISPRTQILQLHKAVCSSI